MSKRAKWSVLGLFVVIIVVVLGLTAFNSRGSGVEVRIEPVERRDLVASVTASGQVQPRTKVDLSADITGRIVQLAVQEGDLVTRGQFLLRIDPEQYSAAVQRAEAGLASAQASAAQAKANHEQAVRNYERSAEIQKSNAALVSEEQMETLRTQVEVTQALLNAAEHQVAQARATLRDAQSSLEKTTIRAPMSGRVTRPLIGAVIVVFPSLLRASRSPAADWSTLCCAASASALFTSTCVLSCSSCSALTSCSFACFMASVRSRLRSD